MRTPNQPVFFEVPKPLPASSKALGNAAQSRR